MTISEIARRVKEAFLAWLKERSEHLFKIYQKEQTVRLVLANRGNRPLTTVQKDEFKKFIDTLKEKFGIITNLSKDNDLMIRWSLQLQ